MKIFNVANVSSLMEKISEVCTDKVELVSEDGLHLELTDGQLPANMLPLYYLKGTVRELELCFANPRDAASILEYLSCLKMAS